MEDSDIDAYIAALPSRSEIDIEFAKFSAMLTAAGYNPAALDDTTEYPYAFNALCWACYFRVLEIDFEGKEIKIKECPTRDLYMRRRQRAREMVCQNLQDLPTPISDQFWCFNVYSMVSFESKIICENGNNC